MGLLTRVGFSSTPQLARVYTPLGEASSSCPRRRASRRFTHDCRPFFWIPACAGMTFRCFSLEKPTPERMPPSLTVRFVPAISALLAASRSTRIGRGFGGGRGGGWAQGGLCRSDHSVIPGASPPLTPIAKVLPLRSSFNSVEMIMMIHFQWGLTSTRSGTEPLARNSRVFPKPQWWPHHLH